LTLWRRAAKVIAPFDFCCFSCAVKDCFKLLSFSHLFNQKSRLPSHGSILASHAHWNK